VEKKLSKFRWIFGRVFFIVLSICGNCAGDSSVGVVDMNRVARESSAGKSIEEQIQAANDNAAKELEELEDRIKDMEAAKKTAEDARKIEDMLVSLYEKVRNKKYQISSAYRRAIEELNRETKKVIKKICVYRKLRMLVTTEAVVYREDEYPDITEEIIRELDAIIPYETVEFL
jgi:Skp family chaperone for outer membrane proteins